MMEEVRKATVDYPRFKDGRIDYSDQRVCFVLNCVVVAGEAILLTRRGKDVIAYPNAINGISGFIDRPEVSIEQQVKNELREELQAPLADIKKLVVSEPFVQVDESINREWHVFAVLAEFGSKFEPVINWENKSAKWYAIEEAMNLKLMWGFDKTLQIALAMRS